MSKYKLSNILPLLFFGAAVVLFFWYQEANATKPKPPETSQEQSQGQGQKQGQDQAQSQHQSTESYSESQADANNEGVTVSSNYESGPGTVFLSPHNNTANCQRVYGLGGGNTSGNVVFGVPFRDKTCDLEAAADDAFSQGNINLGWVFKCKQKNLRKAFGGETECLSAVANPSVVKQLRERVLVLEDQKETLLIERKHDQERCNEETYRAHESCVKK